MNGSSELDKRKSDEEIERDAVEYDSEVKDHVYQHRSKSRSASHRKRWHETRASSQQNLSKSTATSQASSIEALSPENKAGSDSPGLYSCDQPDTRSEWYKLLQRRPFRSDLQLPTLESLQLQNDGTCSQSQYRQQGQNQSDSLPRPSIFRSHTYQELSLVDGSSSPKTLIDPEEDEAAHFPERYPQQPEVVRIPFDLVGNLPSIRTNVAAEGQINSYASNKCRLGRSSLQITPSGNVVQVTTIDNDYESSTSFSGSLLPEETCSILPPKRPFKLYNEDDQNLSPILRAAVNDFSSFQNKYTPAAQPSSTSFSIEFSSLPNSIVSSFIVEFLTVSDIGRLSLTCLSAYRLAKRRRWLRRGAWKTGLSPDIRPRIWLDVCGQVRLLQIAVAEELSQLHSRFVDEWGRRVDAQDAQDAHSEQVPPNSQSLSVGGDKEHRSQNCECLPPFPVFSNQSNCHIASHALDKSTSGQMPAMQNNFPSVSRMHGNVIFKVPFPIFYNSWEEQHKRCSVAPNGCYLQNPNSMPLRTSRYFPIVTRGDTVPETSPVIEQSPSDELYIFGSTLSSQVFHGDSSTFFSVPTDNTTRHIPSGEWAHTLATESNNHDDIPLGIAIFEYLVDEGCCDLSESKKDEIYRDVSRTFPNSPLFNQKDSSGQRWMFDILKSLACLESSVGYCQGMNFIIAGLLTHLRCPIAAFWMGVVLLRCYHYRYIFGPQVPQVPLRMFQFNEIVRWQFPRLWKHLNSHSLAVDFFAHQWLMSLFAYFVDTEISGAIWDIFFLTGWKVIFKVGLALLQVLQPKILEADCEQILQVVQTARRSLFGANKKYTKCQTTSLNESHVREERSLSDSPAECESLRQLQKQKQNILENSSRFKVRTSDLESLEIKFEIRKIEVFMSQIPVATIQARHLNQLLRLPEYTPTIFPNSGSLSEGKMPSISNIRTLVPESNQVEQSTSDRRVEQASRLPMSNIASFSLKALSAIDRLSSSSSTDTRINSSVAIDSRTASGVNTNLAPISTSSHKPSGGEIGPKATSSDKQGLLRSNSTLLPRITSTPTISRTSTWTPNQLQNGNSISGYGGEPLRGTLFIVDLESIKHSLTRLQQVVWELGTIDLPTVTNPQSTSVSKQSHSAELSESLLSFPSSLWSRLRGKIMAPLTPKPPEVKSTQRKRLFTSSNMSISPMAPAMLKVKPALASKSNSLDGPKKLKDGNTEILASSKITEHSEIPTQQQRKQKLSQEESFDNNKNQASGSSFSELYSSSVSSSVSNNIMTGSKTSSISSKSNIDADITNATTSTSSTVSAVQSDINTPTTTDGNVYRKPLISTPTMVFISLQEVTCYNRPLEGCFRLWELLDYKNRIIYAMGQRQSEQYDGSNPTLYVYSGTSSSAKAKECGTGTLLCPQALSTSASLPLDDYDCIYGGYDCRKPRSRVEPPPALEQFNIDLSFVALQLPEIIPVTRQDSHRMVDKKFIWDATLPKHTSTITRKRAEFSLSVGLWGMCLMGKSKASSVVSLRFANNLLNVGSSTCDETNKFNQMTPIINFQSIKRWHSDPFQDLGWETLLLDDLLKARSLLVEKTSIVAQDAAALRAKIAQVEKQTHAIHKEQEELSNNVDSISKLKVRLLARKMKEAKLLQKIIKVADLHHNNPPCKLVSSDGSKKELHNYEFLIAQQEMQLMDKYINEIFSPCLSGRISCGKVPTGSNYIPDDCEVSTKRSVTSWMSSLFISSPTTTHVEQRRQTNSPCSVDTQQDDLFCGSFSDHPNSPISSSTEVSRRQSHIIPSTVADTLSDLSPPKSGPAEPTSAYDSLIQTSALFEPSEDEGSFLLSHMEQSNKKASKTSNMPTVTLASDIDGSADPTYSPSFGQVEMKMRSGVPPSRFHESLVVRSGHLNLGYCAAYPDGSYSDSSKTFRDTLKAHRSPRIKSINSKKALAAQMENVATAERLLDKVNTKNKVLVKSLQEKVDRLEELKELKKMLIDSQHKLLIGEENFKRDTIEALLKNSALWYPRLPSSKLRRLVLESWVKDGTCPKIILSMHQNIPVASNNSASVGGSGVSSHNSSDRSLLKPSSSPLDMASSSNQFIEPSPQQEVASSGCLENSSQSKCRIASLIGSDWNAHRHDVNTPFLINELYEFVNQ